MNKRTDQLPYQKHPCQSCPFRKTSRSLGALGDRMAQIVASDTHTCHQTQRFANEKMLQCAGHMLLKSNENLFVQLATRLGFRLELTGRELVFNTADEAIVHHRSVRQTGLCNVDSE